MADINNLVNTDFQEELRAAQGQAKEDPRLIRTIKAPQTEWELEKAAATIKPEELFGDDGVAGRVPVLTQSFIIQKSRQDKAVELGQIAQEMYETKKVSRSNIIALEAEARNILYPQEQVPQPREPSEEERKVIVSDHEVNMFTEEPSKVEAEFAIGNTQVALDRIIGELRNSAISLGNQLIETATADHQERKEKLYKSIAVFNRAIVKFLTETKNTTLEDVDMKFKRDLRWGDLMAVYLTDSLYDTEKDTVRFEKSIASFDGTSGETLLKDLTTLFTESKNSYNVIRNFILGSPAIITDIEHAINNIAVKQDTQKETYWNPTLTVGNLFKAFGDERFANFYTTLDSNIDTQVTAAKAAVELLNGKTDINEIMALTTELHNQQKSILDTCANMAVLCHVQYLIVKFLSNF